MCLAKREKITGGLQSLDSINEIWSGHIIIDNENSTPIFIVYE